MLLLLTAALVIQEGALIPLPNLEDLMPTFEGTVLGYDEARDFVLSNSKDFGSPTRSVSLTLSDSMRLATVSIAFNGVRLDSEGRSSAWEARFRARRGDRVVEMFADSRTCPALGPTLALLDNLPTHRIDVPDLPGREINFGGGYLHDIAYILRAPAAFLGQRYTQRLELVGGSDAPFAPVAITVFEDLKDCWGAEPIPERRAEYAVDATRSADAP